MAVTRRSGRRRFTVVLLVLTAITLLTLDVRGFAPLDSARSAVLSLLAPVGDLASNVFEPVGERWDAAFNSDQIQQENEDLRRRVDELEGQLTDREVIRDSYRQLLEQVGIPFVADYDTVSARVVSGGVGNFDTTIELDRGSSDGVAKGMPVITGQGLIGRVQQVSDERTVVQLMTDSTVKVGFSVVGTPIIGITEGTGRTGELTGTVNLGDLVVEGQIVVTSGIGESPYPANIPIGTITSIEDDEAGRVRHLRITPFEDLSDLTFASVVLYEAPTS